MSNFMTDFDRLIAKLQDCRNIEVITASVAPGEGVDYINQVLQQEGLQASVQYVEFFSEVDFVRIEWQVPDEKLVTLGLEDSKYTTGRVYIPSFETAISDIKLDGYWFNIATKEFFEASKSRLDKTLLPFDYTEPDVSGCACVEYDGKVIGEKIFYFDHQTGILLISANIEQYVAELSNTMGIYDWQKSLLAPGAVSPSLNNALRRIFGDMYYPA